MIGLSTPVSSFGNTTCSGTSTRLPRRSLHPPEVAGVGPLRIGVADVLGVVERGRIGELRERRQGDAPLPEARHGVGQCVFVDDAVGQPELVLESVAMVVGERHFDSLSGDGGPATPSAATPVGPPVRFDG